YFWMIRRVVVPAGKVLVLLKKDGSRSLPGDQIIVPAPPDQKIDPTGFEKWQNLYADVNGILEEVHQPGTYFGFSLFDYERYVVDGVKVPNQQIGIVVKKFGDKLGEGQVLADASQRGPLSRVLQ